jgi:hypothetical protein
MILYFPYFESPNPERHNEILICLQENIKNKYISKIIVILEKSFPLFPFKSEKLEFWELNKRPTYSDMLEHANNNFQNQTCIISNSDIFFNDTLKELEGVDLNNLFLCLTRYDLKENGNLEYINENFMMRSQDSWIFKSPVPPYLVKNSKFHLGVNACDNMIAKVATDSGLITTNPSLLIESIHLHNSNVRTYASNTGISGVVEFVWPVDSLETISVKERHLIYWQNNIYV